MKIINLIVAINNKNQIGFNDKLLYRNSIDMNFFRETTSLSSSNKINAVIMGRKTWESIPKKFRPLSDRLNIILTKQKDYVNTIDNTENIWIRNNFNNTIEECKKLDDIDKIFIIGGNSLYNLALESNTLTSLYITKINHEFHNNENIISIPKLNVKNYHLYNQKKYEESIGILDLNTLKYPKFKISFCISEYKI